MKKFKTAFLNTEQLPLVIEPENRDIKFHEFLEQIAERREDLKKDLLKYGGLLFRNFPIQNENHFGALIQQLGTGKFIDYIGGDSPRNKVKEGIYTSTEAPPSVKIPLHNELSFVKNFPKHIYFYCAIPSPVGGATIIADARKVYKGINEQVKKRFIENSIKYVSAYYHRSRVMDFVNSLQRSHKSWIQVFETDSKKDVEEKCRQNEFAYKWNKNDWIQISQTRPAVIAHPSTEEKVWFNQAHLYDFNPKLLGWWRYIGAKIFYCRKHTRLHEVYFANGTAIPREDIYHILDVLDKYTLSYPWQKGDVLVLDNVLSMHGRAVFEGKRRILTAMTG
jgi:alpha-ketoglutarate-dependent taurine dioxygenase